MAVMSATQHFGNCSSSENAQGPKLYRCQKFHVFMKKLPVHHKFVERGTVDILSVSFCQFCVWMYRKPGSCEEFLIKKQVEALWK